MQKKQTKVFLIITLVLLALSVLFTVLTRLVDVAAIGPQNSEVGFSAINGFFKSRLPFSEGWYDLSEILGLLPLATVPLFAAVGLYQCLKRKSLFKVDKSIFALGGFYVAVLLVYLLFEIFAVNYRPVLMAGELEASYPSSHTMLAVCFSVSSIFAVWQQTKKRTLRVGTLVAASLVGALVVFARFLSGVHWFTDIVGGLLFSATLLMGLYTVIRWLSRQQTETKAD